MTFGYFGSKRRSAGSYPPPQHDTIIEPFAGAAAYSMHGDNWTRNIILYDIDPDVVAVWHYIQNTPPQKIAALPDITPGGYPIPPPHPAYYLMRWSAGTSRSNTNVPSPFQIKRWPAIRQRVASHAHRTRHWRIIHGDYTTHPNITATWFIDPPYQHQGHQYTKGSDGIHYPTLASWCVTRQGQVIVCEQSPADWLPFSLHQGNRTQTGQLVKELVWTNTPHTLFQTPATNPRNTAKHPKRNTPETPPTQPPKNPTTTKPKHVAQQPQQQSATTTPPIYRGECCAAHATETQKP